MMIRSDVSVLLATLMDIKERCGLLKFFQAFNRPGPLGIEAVPLITHSRDHDCLETAVVWGFRYFFHPSLRNTCSIGALTASIFGHSVDCGCSIAVTQEADQSQKCKNHQSLHGSETEELLFV